MMSGVRAFVDQDRIDLVDDRVVQPARDAVAHL